MLIGSVCSGYGGLEMGIQIAVGGEVAWHVEVDPAPARILAHHWPAVPNLGDLKAIDWASVPPVDLLCGGYPCQPFSLSGLRKGADDERHLWPFIAVAIGHLRPCWLFFENVAGHVTLGLDVVLGDLASLGYDCRWGVIRASEAGAPHQRERLFVLAGDTHRVAGAAPSAQRWGPGAVGGPGAVQGDLRPDRLPADPDSEGLAGWDRSAWGAYWPAIERWGGTLGRAAPLPTEPHPTHAGGARLSPAFVEWMMGLPAGHVTDVPIKRTEQLKALGNGVVPLHAALALEILSR